MSERIPLGVVRPFSPAVLSSGEYATPKRIPLKVLEEAAELVEASKTWLKSDNDPAARQAMLDEMADVLQTVANQCAVFHISESELRDAQTRCETRNRERGRIDAAIASEGTQGKTEEDDALHLVDARMMLDKESEANQRA